jgi:aryl-alcohol dehydrogenase-like predicted oxidoreductase
MYQTRYSPDWMFVTADKFAEFAGKNHFDPAGLAIAWVAGHPAVTAPIIGARNMGQLKSAVAAIDIKMTPELRDKISSLSPEPPPATDRNEERTPFNYGMR